MRSVLLGWIALFAITYWIERPLLAWAAPLLGASWRPTAQLALACAALAAVGWIAGPAVPIFAVTLAIWNFGLIPAIDIPWLLRLLADSFQNSRYLESLLNSLATHVFLFGSLFFGAQRNRQRAELSIK